MNQNIKTETWCGYDIRFVEKDGDWWAILKDVCDALDLRTDNVSRQLQDEYKEDDKTTQKDYHYTRGVIKSDDKTTQKDNIGTIPIIKSNKSERDDIPSKYIIETLDGDPILAKTPFADALGRLRPTLIVTELGLYDVIFQSRKKEARAFKEWVYKALRELRSQSGLDAYQIFRMTDIEHQKKMMSIIKNETNPKTQYSYSNVNQAANRTTSRMYGFDKVLSKGQMAPEMLVDRQAILEEATELTVLKKKYGFDFSVQEKLYQRYPNKKSREKE